MFKRVWSILSVCLLTSLIAGFFWVLLASPFTAEQNSRALGLLAGVNLAGYVCYFWSNKKKRRLIFFLEGSLDAVQAPITTTDLKMKWVFINKVTESLLAQHNLDKKSCLGKHCSSWKADICETENCGINSLRSGKPRTFYNQEYPDRPSTYMQVDTSYIHDDAGKRIGHVEIVTNIDMTQKLLDTAKVLNNSSDLLLSSSKDMSGNANIMKEQSATVEQSFKQMDQTMNMIASSSEEMSASIKTVATSIEEMTSSISEVAKNAEQAASVAGKAASLAETSNDKVGQLGQAADEIGKVIEVIQNIAEQTNLLALNATIEAARAGDAGKGFAVVANEVKELARQTAESTENISKRIRAIQDTSGETVAVIGEIGGVINNVNDVSKTIASAVEEQSITTREIAQNITQVMGETESVTKNISETASMARTISDNISKTSKLAEQTAEKADDTSNASAQLVKMKDTLNHLVTQMESS